MNGAMNKYLLDTNSIIYALNSSFIFPKYEYLISVISEIELLSYSKLTDEESKVLQIAISNFRSIGLFENIKSETIKVKKLSKIKLPDSIIVATAIIENAILVTSDKQLLNSDLLKTIELKNLK